MKQETAVLLLILQICSAYNTWTQPRDICENSDPGSLICSDDCSKVNYCPGGSTTIEYEDCSAEGKRCSGDDPIACVPIDNSTCGSTTPQSPFNCLALGAVVNPYDCVNYYLCTEVNQAPIAECTCGEGQVFDPARLTCVPKDQPDCPDPPKCSTDDICGLIGDSDTHFYYVCKPDKSYFVIKCSSTVSIDPDTKLCKCDSEDTGNDGNEEQGLQVEPYEESCSPYVPPTTETP